MRPFFFPLALAAVLLAPPARAAESFDNCSGYIDSLPAYIGTQGVWCLRKDLSTATTAGEAILVDANNVTIDCNDYKIGGLAAGPTSTASGIASLSRNNTTIRNCNVRGFYIGIWIDAGGGHVVEDNRLEGNLLNGISANSTSGVIRRNLLIDNAAKGLGQAVALYASGSVDILDNGIDGVIPDSGTAHAVGIRTDSLVEGVIAGNRIKGLVPVGTGFSVGMNNTLSGRVQIRDNFLIGDGSTNSVGIYCANTQGLATRNQISGFDYNVSLCTVADNWTSP